MFIEDYEEHLFQETFERTYSDMAEKYATDPHYDLPYIKEFLESMYVYQGHDWDGRGELKHIKNTAVTSALELILDEIESGKLVKAVSNDLQDEAC